MTHTPSIKRQLYVQIALVVSQLLLDADGFSIESWLEEEFGKYPTCRMSPIDWVSRFIREATDGRAEFTFDPGRNQAQLRVGEGDDERLIAYQDVVGPVADLINLERLDIGKINATEMMAMIQELAG